MVLGIEYIWRRSDQKRNELSEITRFLNHRFVFILKNIIIIVTRFIRYPETGTTCDGMNLHLLNTFESATQSLFLQLKFFILTIYS